LGTYKQLIILAGPINFSTTSLVLFALSSDNGATFGGNSACSANSNNHYFSLNLFRTNETSVSKPFYYVSLATSNASDSNSATGVINAIRFTSSSGTMNSGLFVFYGVN
jgi:hypothetical protein